MSKDNQVSMPGVFGGLMRYNEEYKSKIMLKPSTVIVVIIAIAVASIALNLLIK